MCCYLFVFFVCFFKQKTAYEMRISDWSSDVCSSDLIVYLFMAGGPSQFETFDYKPKLVNLAGQDLPDSVRNGQRLTGMSASQSSLPMVPSIRSEEHTSELQSLMRISYAVFCLKKKKNKNNNKQVDNKTKV